MPQPSVSLSSPSLCLPTQSQCPSQLILHNRSGKLCYVEPLPRRPYVMGFSFFKEPTKSKKGDIDKLVLFVIHCMPPALTLPGDRLRREEGLSALHPVVLLPGIVTGSLELWEGKPCTEGLFRKRLWGGGFTEIFKRPLCWLEHLSLDNETGLDPPGIRVRAVPGLVAADYSSPGYFVWAVLIQNLARIGYEEKNLHMAAYDWRLSFQNTEVRDHALSTLKSQIELMYSTNGNKRVVVVPHSMGVLYFLHFLKWVEMPPPLGSGGGPTWCSKHIKAVMNIAPAFLGVPKAMTNIISNEGKDIAAIRLASLACSCRCICFRLKTDILCKLLIRSTRWGRHYQECLIDFGLVNELVELWQAEFWDP
ncbi:hypothetical protein SAY86_019420 [Trapa natans]|uniref:Phospholipid:diacylglycerol acyltransferase n=1 Tax=Trapa natans TaxID=22666 RepID=A0AAN7R5J1_TRANT|nr:hypothetical protein SAY86_019420 [Trapa natans]